MRLYSHPRLKKNALIALAPDAVGGKAMGTGGVRKRGQRIAGLLQSSPVIKLNLSVLRKTNSYSCKLQKERDKITFA